MERRCTTYLQYRTPVSGSKKRGTSSQQDVLCQGQDMEAKVERPRQFRSCEWQSRGMEIQLGEVPTAPWYPVAAIYLGESSIKDSPPGACAACECPVRPPDTASSAHPSTSPRQETAREWSGSGMRCAPQSVSARGMSTACRARGERCTPVCKFDPVVVRMRARARLSECAEKQKPV